MLKVACDLDGVVYDFESHARKALREVFGDDPGPGPSRKFDAIKFSVSRDAWTWLWSDAALDHVWSGPPIPEAFDGVRELQKLAEVTPLTSRPLNARPHTDRLLAQLCLPAAIYVSCMEDKAKHDFDVFIEDSPGAIEAMIRAQKTVIIFDRPWNQSLFGYEGRAYTNAPRAKTWDDVVELVRRFAIDHEELPPDEIPDDEDFCHETGFVVKDSGQRLEIASGMFRDVTEGKTRYDLVFDGPMFERWAEHLTKGAEKYDARNWMKASGDEEADRFRQSAVRHFMQWLRGDPDEDHASAVFFNINGFEYVNDPRQEGTDEGSTGNRR